MSPMIYSNFQKNWILSTALRLMASKRRSRSRITSLLSILGLSAGILTLITVISVMNGFQLNTIEDLIEISSFHLRIQGPFPDSAEGIAEIKGITSVFPLIETQALIRGYFSSSQSVVFKAVEGDFFQENTSLAQRLGVSRTIQLRPGEVILGRELARFLGVSLGDTIQSIGLGGNDLSLDSPVNIEFRVSGLFVSGYYEFDRNWAFINIDTAETELNSGYRKELVIQIEDRNRDIQAIHSILEQYPHLDTSNIQSWRQYNRSIFSALRIEKTLIFLMVGLIFLVVGVNIFQGLRRSVYEHTEDIAVLKVLGASDRDVQYVFISEGLIIACISVLIGLPSGVILSTGINEIFSFVESIISFINQRNNYEIFSPTYFYLQEVPVHIIPLELIGIVFTASASAIISAYLASRRVTQLYPKEIFNNE